ASVGSCVGVGPPRAAEKRLPPIGRAHHHLGPGYWTLRSVDHGAVERPAKRLVATACGAHKRQHQQAEKAICPSSACHFSRCTRTREIKREGRGTEVAHHS